ncbi:MAG: hypothetical protein PHQ11_04685, partial [Paludibacter sp.]|nr:hypothetical protein [Paludibacter sp.]
WTCVRSCGVCTVRFGVFLRWLKMSDREREDFIQSIAATIERNNCAIKREDLYKKYSNTERDKIKRIVEVMLRRGTLKYDARDDKYWLIL